MHPTDAGTGSPPDAHDQRIAKLRARRRARMRWLAVRASLGAGVLVLLAAAFVYWLVTTIGGRDLLLAQIVARLPDTTTLSWQRAEGPASGPMTLHGVRFTHNAIVFTAERVMLDPALTPLLGRRLRLDALAITGATLDLPESDEPFELPRWPDSLPQIAPPLSLRADDVRIDGLRVTRERAPLVDIARVRGGIDAQAGRLHVERLVVDSDRGRFTVHGDYAPRDDYRTDLVATAVLPAPTGTTRPRLGFVARGDLAKMDVAIGGRAPGPLRATLVLRTQAIATTTMTGTGEVVSAPVATPLEKPQWQLNVDAEALDLSALLEPGAAPAEDPLALQLHARGTGGAMRLRGQVRQGELDAKILTSNVRIENQVLRMDPLHVEVLDGTVIVRGDADFNDPKNATFRVAANARDLRWGGAKTTAAGPAATPAAPAVVADGDFGMAGTSRAWALIGKATLARDGQQARLDIDGRGDAEQLRLRTLRVAMPTGTLDATGAVRWAPSLGWDVDATLAGFDPGYFAPGWDGAVNGQLETTGRTRDDGGIEAALAVADLGGRLRGRPLDGRGKFAMHGAAPTGGTTRYDGELALSLGASRIDAKGSVGDALAIDARFTPLNLADLVPDGSGSLRGTLQLRGPRTAPDIDVDLAGSGLGWGDYRAETLDLRGRLPWSRGNGTLAVRGSGLDVGIPFDSLRLDARGAVESLQFDADARGDLGTLALSGNADKRGNTWQGALASLQLAPERGATWRLQQPARFRWTAGTAPASGNGTLANTCLASSAGGSLCASADWPRRGVTIAGQRLPLALLVPYLPEREDNRPWLLRGEASIDAQLRPSGSGWSGQARIRSASGGLKSSERSRRELVHYDDLLLTATFRPQGIEAQLGAALFDDGRIDARITTGWDGYAPLAGTVAIDTDELTWMELFSPDIVEPEGRLAGRISLGGTRAQPRLGGQARLTGFTTEMPALAITLTDGNLQLDAQPDGSARINGSVRSGEGVLDVSGTLGWQGDDTPLVLNLRGRNVLVSDTRDLRAVASPDVVVRVAAGQPVTVTGTVVVDSAQIDLERLDQGVAVSPDVIVLDPVDPTDDGLATPVQLDLTLVVGDDVQLSGFGLDGTLDGQLRVRTRPGREMTASGTLDVDGEYTAYGQELDITRGRLSWSNDPVGDPVLDVRAERKVGEITAGVDVSGRATSPQARVWSNPASSQSEALAYLALGRPLSTTSGDERGQLNAASAALSAGGSLLASQLGARIGLDDAGVMQSRALGGSVFGIGKYLSPRLYVGYGVSLLGTGQVLTLKYLLGRGFDIEVESSTVENRGSLNWRKEK